MENFLLKGCVDICLSGLMEDFVVLSRSENGEKNSLSFTRPVAFGVLCGNWGRRRSPGRGDLRRTRIAWHTNEMKASVMSHYFISTGSKWGELCSVIEREVLSVMKIIAWATAHQQRSGFSRFLHFFSAEWVSWSRPSFPMTLGVRFSAAHKFAWQSWHFFKALN